MKYVLEKQLYQYDQGVYIIVPDEYRNCTAQFYSKSFPDGLAMENEIVNGKIMCQIPNQMLVNAESIIVYAFRTGTNIMITESLSKFSVTARPKPPDFVLDPTDTITYKTASDLITDMQTAKSEESKRVTAETLRATAETERASSETVRKATETERVKAESERAVAETARSTAETARANSEISREVAETNRANAETSRSKAESSREAAEQERVNAETDRASAEQARITAETERASAESDRASAEQLRAAAETERAGFYEGFNSELNSLKDDLVALDGSLRGNAVNYNLRGKLERGGIVSGNNYDGDDKYRKSHWRSKEFILDGYKDITIQSNDDNFTFKVWILFSMTGNYNDSGWVTQFEIDGNDRYRIAFGTVDNVEFSEQDILSHISIVGTKSYTDKTLSIENMSADAKKSGTEIENIKNFISYKKDISEQFTIYYGKNVYFASGILVFEDSNNYRCRTDLFNTQGINVLVNLKDGIKAIYYVKEDGVWTNPVTWITGAFYLPKNVDIYISFGKTDGSTFIGDEPLADFTEIYSNKTNLVPKFRLIHSISQELVVSDNNNESGAMQGMCFDGENIWYYITSDNSLRKYNIDTTETTQYTNLGLGHGNDITYNPNTRKLYIAVTDGTSPIVKTIDIDTMTVSEFELNEFDGSIASIAYSKETDEYAVIGGQAYDRDGNTDGWTRKQMVIYDKNFDSLKNIILKNDYSATQGIEFDGRYIYFCKSFYNGSHNDKVYVYDVNGNLVSSFSSGTGEVEAIAKIDDYNFYIARCENSYNGGYIYKATVTSESYANIVDVLYEKYIN